MLIFMFLSLAMPFSASIAGLVVSRRAVPQHALAVLDPHDTATLGGQTHDWFPPRPADQWRGRERWVSSSFRPFADSDRTAGVGATSPLARALTKVPCPPFATARRPRPNGSSRP